MLGPNLRTDVLGQPKEMRKTGNEAWPVFARARVSGFNPLATGQVASVTATLRKAGPVAPPSNVKPSLAHPARHRDLHLESPATAQPRVERRESRGCHNRSDHPQLDRSLQVNLVWSGPRQVKREAVPPVPDEIAALMHDVSTSGKLLE